MKLTAEATVLNDDKLTSSINNAQNTADSAKTIADNTNQYFWFTSSGTDTGAHISEKTQAQFIASPSGGNLLARSNGIAVRDGLTELATFSASGVDINNGGASVASFGTDARIGKDASGHATVKSDGLHVWTATESTPTNEVASFGATARIGKTSAFNTTVTGTEINFYNGSTWGGSISYPSDFVINSGANNLTLSGNKEILLEANEAIRIGSLYDSVYVESTLNIDSSSIKNLYGYNDTVSSKPNMYIGTTGLIHRTTYVVDNTSSKRFKHDIKDVTNPTLDPHLLYDIEVKQFRFNDDTEASRKGIDLIGFIAEQVEEVYPIAVDYDENGQVETWREHYIIPPMLKLIQEQHEQIEALTKRIEALERKAND